MTPRTFFNILKAKNAEWKQKEIMHQELVLAMLTPHMKKQDRDKAYTDLYGKTAVKGAKKKKREPLTPDQVKALLEKANN